MRRLMPFLVLVVCMSVFLGGCGNSQKPVPTPEKTTSPKTANPPVVPPPPPVPQPEKTTLYRDTWGVPHIYAGTLANAAYAMGYAQAEDRLDDLYLNVRMAIGSMAEITGKNMLASDYRMQLVANADRCKQYWETAAPPELRAIGDSFVHGVQAYLKEHPEKQSPYTVELQGWQPLAISRALIFNWPLDVIQEKVERKKDAPPFSSNSFAVAPARSADGSAILMTDPHLTWEGMAVFYEGRMHAEGVDMAGYWIVGSPLPVLGHTGYVAWACTTGGPDTSDAYMVKINPANPMQYQYNGEWKDFEQRSVTIKVKDQEPETKTVLKAIHGPVWEVDSEKGIAYCGASRYIESFGLLEQSLKMVKAKSGDEFYQALAMGEFMEQNISFADTQGHIQYVRNGSVPIRPDGFNWNVPVPGGTDATKWKGFHDIKDLVQVKDPTQGYFQNCNCSPAVMMRDSPMTPDKYKDYIYNVSWDKKTPRSERLLQLLDADSSITHEEAMAYTLDVYDLMAKPWQQALSSAVDALKAGKGEKATTIKKDEKGKKAPVAKKGKATTKGKATAKSKATKKQDYMADPEFAKVVADILAWNGEYTQDSVAAPFVMFWRLKCEPLFDTAAIAEGKTLSAEDQGKMLSALAETVSETKTRYGRLDLKWGDIKVVGRGGKFFPCDGADFGDKKDRTQTPMVTGTSDKPDEAGRYVARKGSSTLMLSFLSKAGVDSYSLVVWGQSADPASPHYVDQSEKLYSQRKFKPTWFKKEDLLKNMESEKILTP